MDNSNSSFFKKLKYSIFNFEKYPEMAACPLSKVIKYLLQIIAIFTLVVTLLFMYNISKNFNNGIEYFKSEIPDLKIEDNQLYVESENKITIEDNNIFDLIIINTNDISADEIESYKLDIEKYDTGIIFLKDKLILNMGTGNIEYLYKEIAQMYNIGDMTKQDILNYFTGSNLVMIFIAIFAMSFLWLFISYLTSTFLDIIILGLLGYLTAILIRLRLKFVAMIKIAVHALTLPLILNLCYIIIQTLFGYQIKYFEIMYIGISYIYIITAILMIKSDLIKRGQELSKIVEEQQRVKEEIEQQRQEEKKEEDKKENKKENDKEDEKSDQEENLGKEAQGENA